MSSVLIGVLRRRGRRLKGIECNIKVGAGMREKGREREKRGLNAHAASFENRERP